MIWGENPTIFGSTSTSYIIKNIKRKTEKSGKNTHHYCTFHLKEKMKKKTNKPLSLVLSCLLKISSRTDWAGAGLWEMEMVALTGLSVLPFCNWPSYLQYCKNLNHGDFEFFGAILALKTMLDYVGL